MADSDKNLTKIGLIVMCVVLAGILVWRSASGGGPTGIDSVSSEDTLLTRCANRDCHHQAEMNKRVYYSETLKRQSQNPNIGHPPLECAKCGKNSVFRVVLCPKCEHIFKHGGMRNEPADRCPECRYSQSQEDRKQGV